MNPNQNFPFPKGSEWSKWDLHFHTPSSYDYKDQSVTNDQIIDCLSDNKISVVAITDHHVIDVARIKELSNLGSKKGITVLPGIEFLSDARGHEPVHFIAIFPEDMMRLDYIWEQIKNRTNISRIQGENKKHNEIYCDLLDTIKIIKELGGIVTIHAGDKSNSIEAITNSLPHTIAQKKDIADVIDIFELGKESDQNDYTKIVFPSIKKIIPMVICSDNHDIKQYKLKQNCWIKANPTFEGLKQTIFEPIDRIAIQTDEPDNKKPYFVIDQVRFIDNTGLSLFPSEYIQINQNLSTIVGGKSTGKSLLLHYIGKTVDEFEVALRLGEVGASLGYDFDTSPNFNFEVKWRDGYSSWLKTMAGAPEEIGERKILYIPQNFLNKLSEKNIKSKDTLNGFVQNILLQDETIKDKNQELQDQIKNLSKTIPVDITEVFTLKKEIAQVEEEAKQIGDEKGIEAFISSLEKEIDSIKNESGLNQEEITQYESLVEKEKDITTKISNLQEDKKTIGSFEESMNSEIFSISSTHEEYTNYLNDGDIKKKFVEESGFITGLNESLQKLVFGTTAEIERKITEYKKDLAVVKKDLEPLLSRVKLQTELNKKNDTIKGEQQKLDKLASKKKTFGLKTELLKSKTNELKKSYLEINSKYEALKNEFKKYENRFDDITISVNIGFRSEDFNIAVIDEFINKVSLKKVLKQVSGEEYEYQYDPQTHIDIMHSILDGLISDNIKTIKGRSSRDAIQKLLENRFYLDFKIGYQGDPLDKMSPGKKSLVLLKLLIDLSDEEWPILLDQPEDDLDNRSVYKDLVLFLKEKKKQRQIIIVTHNPNLTVGSDTEEVIVANQEGQEIGRDNKKFKFEYVSGGLENSFELDEVTEPAILYRKGIRQHVCEVLEGGKEAFQKREQKYNFN